MVSKSELQRLGISIGTDEDLARSIGGVQKRRTSVVNQQAPKTPTSTLPLPRNASQSQPKNTRTPKQKPKPYLKIFVPEELSAPPAESSVTLNDSNERSEAPLSIIKPNTPDVSSTSPLSSIPTKWDQWDRDQWDKDEVEIESDYEPKVKRQKISSQATKERKNQRITKRQNLAQKLSASLNGAPATSPNGQPSPRTPLLKRSLRLNIPTPKNESEATSLPTSAVFALEQPPTFEDDTSTIYTEYQTDSPTQTFLLTPSSIHRYNFQDFNKPDSLSPHVHAEALDQPIDGIRSGIQLDDRMNPTQTSELKRLSIALAELATATDKSDPEGQPLVWSDSRQILCEAVPYYRAFHGAGYAHGGFAHAFMFDGQASERDYMDSNVIISRAGGGYEKDSEGGKYSQTRDTKETALVKSVRKNLVSKQPVVIITGNKNPTAQVKVPHRYCVLDWFKPTHVWAEKSGRCKTIRYRFEVLDPTKPSWWKVQGMEEPVQLGELPPPVSHRCSLCQKESQQIYLNGWMCTEYHCPAFWKFVDGTHPVEESLRYDPRFLKQKTIWPHVSPPQSTKPNPWILEEHGIDNFDHGFVWQATKAIVCPNCGKCGARDHWSSWQCGNCPTKYDVPRRILPAYLLHDWYNPLTEGYAADHDDCDSSVKTRIEFMGNYRVNIFEISGIEGFVAHMVANKTINEEAGGPDDMFMELQKEDIGLQRRQLKSGEGSLCNHFTMNFGMPYSFIAATDSTSFDDAPKAINAARSRLNWSARNLVGKDFDQQFNEVLALAYMEGNKINYHDDGETGLGPTIATLSLGYPAQMSLRMKQKHFKGCTEKRFVDRPPLPGCLRYDDRLEAYRKLQTLDKKSPEYKKRLGDLPTELGLNSKVGVDVSGKTMKIPNEASALINMKLCHGDIVVMHGRMIQEYYEHAVTPDGKLRFALTSRHIELDSLKYEDKPKWEVKDEKEPYDGFKLPEPGSSKV